MLKNGENANSLSNLSILSALDIGKIKAIERYGSGISIAITMQERCVAFMTQSLNNIAKESKEKENIYCDSRLKLSSKH